MATGYRAEGTAFDFKPDCQSDGSEYRALLAGRRNTGQGVRPDTTGPPTSGPQRTSENTGASS